MASSASARSRRRSSPASPDGRRSTCLRAAPRGRAGSPHEAARALFERLGGALAVDDERALETLSASTATIAAHFAYLDTIGRWLAGRGIPETDATRYVAAVFGTLLSTEPAGFATLAEEYATAGGLNEQFLGALRSAGVYDAVEHALDDVAQRLA